MHQLSLFTAEPEAPPAQSAVDAAFWDGHRRGLAGEGREGRPRLHGERWYTGWLLGSEIRRLRALYGEDDGENEEAIEA